MDIHTKAVHIGDRKKAGAYTPVTTPIHTATSYFYESTEQLDHIFAQEEQGYCYSRYDNPSTAALEELVNSLENGAGALACASGMAANTKLPCIGWSDARSGLLISRPSSG